MKKIYSFEGFPKRRYKKSSSWSFFVVFVYPIPKCSHKKTVDLVNRVGFRKIYRQESTIILFHSCTDRSNVLCLSLLELEEHFGSDILDKGKGGVAAASKYYIVFQIKGDLIFSKNKMCSKPHKYSKPLLPTLIFNFPLNYDQ